MKFIKLLLVASLLSVSATALAEQSRNYSDLKVERNSAGDVLLTIPYMNHIDPKTGDLFTGTVTKNLMDNDKIVKINGEDVVRDVNHVCKYQFPNNPNITECKPRLIPWCKIHKKVMYSKGNIIPPCTETKCKPKLEWKTDDNPPPFIHYRPDHALPLRICAGKVSGSNYWIKIYQEDHIYYEPNMFNGTYVVNGQSIDVDIYEQKTRHLRVYADPISSLRSDTVSMVVDGRRWFMFKDANGQWKCHTGLEYALPDAELVRYALIAENVLGINPTGYHFLAELKAKGHYLGQT